MSKLNLNIGDHMGESEIIDLLVAEGIIRPSESFCRTYIVERPFGVTTDILNEEKV